MTEWFATDLKPNQRVEVTSGFQQRYRCHLAIAADQLAHGLEVTDYIKRSDWQPKQPNVQVWTLSHSGSPFHSHRVLDRVLAKLDTPLRKPRRRAGRIPNNCVSIEDKRCH